MRVLKLDYDPDDPDRPGTEPTPEAGLADYLASAPGAEDLRTFRWTRHETGKRWRTVFVGTDADDATERFALQFEHAGTRGFWSLSGVHFCSGAG
jgi:hypothetical protein